MAEGDLSPAEHAGQIIDARGRSVSQLDPVMMHLLHRPCIIPPDVLRKIAPEVGLGITRGTRVLLWGSIVGIVGLALTTDLPHCGDTNTPGEGSRPCHSGSIPTITESFPP